MPGKRNQVGSSPPSYEHIVWKKKRTSRGSKFVGKVAVSPGTPRMKKLPVPQSRKRMEGGPDTGNGPDLEAFPSAEPIPMKLPKPKRSGKVCQSLFNSKKEKLRTDPVTT